MRRSRKPGSRRVLAPLHADRHEQVKRKKHRLKLHKSQSYGDVVRRTFFFQLRLAADNLRDLMLSPIAIVAALLGLLRPSDPSWALDRLMLFGRATDRWINLFEEEDKDARDHSGQTLDDLFDHVESKIKTKLDPDTPAEESSWASCFDAFQASRQSRK